MKKLSLILFILLSLNSQSIVIEKDTLNLSFLDKNPSTVYSLDGKWLFYWKKFITQDVEKKYTPDLRVPVPSRWMDHKINMEELPSDGFATYVLHVKNAPNIELGFRLKYLRSAYRFYVNDSLLVEKGKVSDLENSYKMGQGIEYVYFKPKNSTFTIYIHLANYDHYFSGITRKMKIGTSAALKKFELRNIILDVAVFSSLFAFGVYHLILFFIRKENTAPLYFALFCAVGVVRTLVLQERTIFLIFPEISSVFVDLVNIGSYYFGVSIFVMFIDRMFPDIYPLKFRNFFVYSTLLLGLATFSGSLSISYKLEIVAHILSLCYVITVCFYFSKAYRVQKTYVSTFFIGLLIVVGFFIHDVLIGISVLHHQMKFPLGMLLFFIFYAFVIAKRYEYAFHTNKMLSKYLDESNKTLESKVHQRTEELKLALDLAESTADAKSRFLSFMTHELRTPVNAVIGYSELIEEEMEETGETSHLADVKKISTAGKHLLSVVNNVLDLSKAESGMLELTKEQISVKALLREVKHTLGPIAEENHDRFTINNYSDIKFLTNDKTKLKQIIINIVGNALKFTSEGTVKVDVFSDEEMIKFVISDTGIGMTEDQVSRLFFEFQQAHSLEKKNYGGTGLGLVLSKLFIERMGGEIDVKSEYNVGSTFTVLLPIHIN